VATCEPIGHEEALKDTKWKQAMEDILIIQENETWETVDKPEDREVIGVEWHPDCQIVRHQINLTNTRPASFSKGMHTFMVLINLTLLRSSDWTPPDWR